MGPRAMSIVRSIWTFNAVLCDKHIVAYMAVARSDLEACWILQTTHMHMKCTLQFSAHTVYSIIQPGQE